METAESVAVVAERIKDEIRKIRSRVDRLDDIGLSLTDSDLEADLRSVAAEIRESTDSISEELEPEVSCLAG